MKNTPGNKAQNINANSCGATHGSGDSTLNAKHNSFMSAHGWRCQAFQMRMLYTRKKPKFQLRPQDKFDVTLNNRFAFLEKIPNEHDSMVAYQEKDQIGIDSSNNWFLFPEIKSVTSSPRLLAWEIQYVRYWTVMKMQF